MKKAGPGLYIGVGAAVVVIGGLVAFAFSGGNTEEKAAAAEKAVEHANSGLSTEELKERKAHLEKTQAALAAVGADKPAEPAQPAPTAAPAPADEPPASAATPAAKGGSSAPAAKPASSAAAKKKADSLDALGADIAAGLK